MKRRINVLATLVSSKCLFPAFCRKQEALVFTNDETERQGWSAVPKAIEEKVAGNISFSHQVVSQCVEMDNHFTGLIS